MRGVRAGPSSSGSVAPPDCSSNSGTGTDKGYLAETRHGETGEYSLACSRGPGARANTHLDEALGNKSPSHALGGSCCPLGPRCGERLTSSVLGDWDIAPSLKGDVSRASRPQNASSWHLCDFPMAHYEFCPITASRC